MFNALTSFMLNHWSGSSTPWIRTYWPDDPAGKVKSSAIPKVVPAVLTPSKDSTYETLSSEVNTVKGFVARVRSSLL